MNYGVPYMGSKSRIVKEVCDLFPKAENFYDLFAGGCAVTHYLLDKHKFKNFHINDISDSVQLFMDAVNGKFAGDTRWISREEFFAKKDTDPYIRYCWSFGNMGTTYMYAKEIEEWKRALHHVFLLNDYSVMKKFGIEDEGMTRTSIAKNAERYREKYVEWYLKNVDSELSDHRMESLRQFGSVQNLQNLQRVQRLNSLQRMKYFNIKERLTMTMGDYQSVEIKPNSLIYTDIPYSNTAEYNESSFDYERFYDWACNQSNPVFISEYSMPDDRFECVKEIELNSILSATAVNKVIEKVFVPKGQMTTIHKQLKMF